MSRLSTWCLVAVAALSWALSGVAQDVDAAPPSIESSGQDLILSGGRILLRPRGGEDTAEGVSVDLLAVVQELQAEVLALKETNRRLVEVGDFRARPCLALLAVLRTTC